MDWASYPGTNEFSPRWLGPASSDHLPWGQAAAIDVLNAAIEMMPVPDPMCVFGLDVVICFLFS